MPNKRASRLAQIATELKSGKHIKKRRAKRLVNGALDELLAQPTGGMFKKLASLFQIARPPQKLESAEARKARIERNLTSIHREAEQEKSSTPKGADGSRPLTQSRQRRAGARHRL